MLAGEAVIEEEVARDTPRALHEVNAGKMSERSVAPKVRRIGRHASRALCVRVSGLDDGTSGWQAVIRSSGSMSATQQALSSGDRSTAYVSLPGR